MGRRETGRTGKFRRLCRREREWGEQWREGGRKKRCRTEDVAINGKKTFSGFQVRFTRRSTFLNGSSTSIHLDPRFVFLIPMSHMNWSGEGKKEG